jgi:hypothetical protein
MFMKEVKFYFYEFVLVMGCADDLVFLEAFFFAQPC